MLKDMVVRFWGSVNLSLDRLTCSHRLQGLPSSSGSISPLQLGALPPQAHSGSFLAWNGRTSTAPEQALSLSSIVSLSHTRKPSSRSIDHSQASYTGAHTRRRTTILPLQNNSLRPVKVRSSEELTEPLPAMESRLAEAGILADKKMVTKEFYRQ